MTCFFNNHLSKFKNLWLLKKYVCESSSYHILPSTERRVYPGAQLICGVGSRSRQVRSTAESSTILFIPIFRTPLLAGAQGGAEAKILKTIILNFFHQYSSKELGELSSFHLCPQKAEQPSPSPITQGEEFLADLI